MGWELKKLWIARKQKSPPSMGWELQKIMDSWETKIPTISGGD